MDHLNHKQPAEHPINFTGDEVAAAKDGRKSQSRVVVKPSSLARYAQHPASLDHEEDFDFAWAEYALENDAAMDSGAVEYAHFLRSLCPLYQPGDLLWVREGCHIYCPSDFGEPWDRPPVTYMADEPVRVGKRADWLVYKHATQMPKWCARFWFRVSGVRVERIQDITPEDCLAEGIKMRELSVQAPLISKAKFNLWWDRAHPDHPVKSNPWVWVYEYQPFHPRVQ